jgi:hypothetical protein
VPSVLRSVVAEQLVDPGVVEVEQRGELLHLDQGVAFWSAVLYATEETLGVDSQPIYRRLELPESEIRVLLQRTDDRETSPKERMHLDSEVNDVEAEVRRIEALGATRWDHQNERGHEFRGSPRPVEQRILRPAARIS